MSSSRVYTVQLERRAEREMRNLPQHVISRIDAIFGQLESNPRPPGVVKLSGQMGASWRIRVGAYRILYRIDDENRRVKIYRIKHRGRVYR